MPQYMDITLTIHPHMPVWPGDPTPEVTRMRSIAEGHVCNVSRFAAGVHLGTHLDAPLHFIDGAGGVETLALETLIGPAVVADVGDADRVDVSHLEAMDLPADCTRLLIKSRNSALWSRPGTEFHADYVALTPEAADWVVARGIKLVGIDYLSIERYKEPGHVTHHKLLGAGVIAVEGLDLRGVEPGPYKLICLPMKIAGSDGAFVRAVLEG
ncbi:cyclase family protein [Magnetospira sp. QH-2]|uniref:cyclase family protein n=1 Tax=Magnetospira sp. (strain QH-2) TaxID=1288970 RepID=UPI0003E80C41|nr:cyclase family protein [Magnetospira sp. QH-2]CCQ72895.1 Putative Kynurenine formamidase [Magnetospira sp. QH-2]